jgi:DNA-binding NarL/FixJ family response regulator
MNEMQKVDFKNTATNPIKIVVIDDNDSFRWLIKEIVRTEEDIQICGEAETLDDARKIILQWRPHIVLLDISVDEREGGLNFLQEVRQLNASTHCIIISAHAEAFYADKSLKAGAKGYISKDKTVRCLVNAIREIYMGKEYVSTQVSI